MAGKGWRRATSDSSLSRRGPLFAENYNGPSPTVSLISRSKTSPSRSLSRDCVTLGSNPIMSAVDRRTQEAKRSLWCKSVSLPFEPGLDHQSRNLLDARTLCSIVVPIQRAFRRMRRRLRQTQTSKCIVKIQVCIRCFLLRLDLRG